VKGVGGGNVRAADDGAATAYVDLVQMDDGAEWPPAATQVCPNVSTYATFT
jgi:hypothetical protein